MRQRLALVAVEQNDVARLGLLLAQSQTQAGSCDLGSDLACLQRVPRPAPAELFSQRLGKLRPADANALTRLDLDLQPRDRPVAPVGYRLFEQGRDDARPLHSSPGPDRALRWPSAPPRRRARSRCATGEPCPRARRTPRRSGDSSSRPASTVQSALCPPRRDHAIPRGSATPLFAPRSPPTTTCPPCSAPREIIALRDTANHSQHLLASPMKSA